MTEGRSFPFAELEDQAHNADDDQGVSENLTVCDHSDPPFCKLGIDTISKMSKGTDILTLNFAKIADHLDGSVDYLLGRTDKPEANK